MAIANPLVLSYNAGTKSLVRINQDSYGSEYYLREATQDFRVKIRHLREAAGKNGVVIERHNVELTQTIFATVAGTPDEVIQVYAVIRNAKTSTAVNTAKLGNALSAFLDDTHYQDLVNWVN
nr:MAG: putative coat protein [Leviviridae sp.]